jgi:hypothetical protein
MISTASFRVSKDEIFSFSQNLPFGEIEKE